MKRYRVNASSINVVALLVRAWSVRRSKMGQEGPGAVIAIMVAALIHPRLASACWDGASLIATDGRIACCECGGPLRALSRQRPMKKRDVRGGRSGDDER
jgi:hypothetical protein